MGQRPWTAILTSSDKHITAINIVASLERQKAQVEIEKLHDGHKLVALIPGTHASSTHTFCQSVNTTIAPAKKSDTSRWVDPYDTSHITSIDDSITVPDRIIKGIVSGE